MKKLNEEKRITKIKAIIVLGLAALLSWVVFLNQANPEITIKIEATATKNQASWGTDVRIHHVRINKKEIPFQELTFGQEWEYLDDLLVAVNPGHKASVEYTVKNARRLDIDLQKHNGSGIVKISANDLSLGEIDLYASDWEEMTFQKGLGAVVLLSEWPMFLAVFVGMIFLCILIVRVLSEIKKAPLVVQWLRNIIIPYIILGVGGLFYNKIAASVAGGLLVLLAGVLLSQLVSLCRKKQNMLCFFGSSMGILLLSSTFLFGAVETINGNNGKILFGYALGNIGIYLVVMLAIYVISRRTHVAVGLGTLIALVYGISNYYVTLFRGTPIVSGDFFIIGTAKNVLLNYKYTISWEIFCSVMLLSMWCIIVWSVMVKSSQTEKKAAFIGGVPLVVLGLCIFRLDFYKPSLDLWDLNNNIKQYGVAMSLLSSIRNMKISAPADYSYEKIEKLCNQYTAENPKDDFNPNVIAIMNESYSDLSVLSDVLDSESYMPYFNSLKENTLKGRALVSTIGGGTGNTEYEFLTGNSMAFFPGTVPYQQFVVRDAFSLATIFHNRGYSTTAIHPYYKSGYNRQRVYPHFGFEQFLDIDSFENPKLSRDRFITDEESYKKVIEVFEESQKEGKPAFVFNVTIQNHSDYTTGFYENQTIKVPTFENYFPDAEEYLTLIKESDDAFKDLIDYFSSIQEPTVIVMFGDHQPNVDLKFYEAMLGKPLEELSLEESQKRYEVPFFIWANYDIEEQEDIFTSINYLPTILFREAGITMTPYQKFLSEMEEHIPAININGYMGSDGQWYGITEENVMSTWIDNYWNIQYNNIFDKKKMDNWYS